MIVRGSQLTKIRDQHPDERIVLGTGCFDLVHEGHGSYLEQAHKLGDLVVISLLGYRKVRELKGEPKPFRSTEHRAATLDRMKNVDYVTVEPYRPGNGRLAFFETLTKLRPDAFLGDETWQEYAEAIEDMGTEFYLRTPEKIDSTSAIIQDFLTKNHLLPRPA